MKIVTLDYAGSTFSEGAFDLQLIIVTRIYLLWHDGHLSEYGWCKMSLHKLLFHKYDVHAICLSESWLFCGKYRWFLKVLAEVCGSKSRVGGSKMNSF